MVPACTHARNTKVLIFVLVTIRSLVVMANLMEYFQESCIAQFPTGRGRIPDPGKTRRYALLRGGKNKKIRNGTPGKRFELLRCGAPVAFKATALPD